MKQELLHDNYLEMRFSRVFSFIKELVSLRLMLLCVLVISGLTLGTQEAKCANKYTYSYVYLDLSGFTSWANDGATFKVQLNTWDNCTGGAGVTVSMNAVPGVSNLYYADVSSVITTDRYGLQFQRCSSNGSTVWNSFCVAYSSGNCGVPSNWNAGSMTTTACTSPSAFTFSNINRESCTKANIAWSASAPALLVRYLGSSPSITNPTSGQSYSSGNTIGNGTVMYGGTASSYSATFDADKAYTFVIYRVSTSGYCYSTSASTTLPVGVPTVTTTAAASVDATSATLGGDVTAKGVGGAILNRGIEWTVTIGGKTAGSREVISTANATGTFSKSFTGLTSGTTYKYKAYATNNSCSSSYGYGAEESFTTSTSCTTPTSEFAASANPSTVYISNTAYAEVTLSTSQTADAYQWECVSHPSYGIYNTPTIVSSKASSTTVQLPIEGTYTFRVGAKCTADAAYTYSKTVTVTANLNLWMKGPLFQNGWGSPTNVAWSISNNVRTYTLNPAYYNTGGQPREFVLNAYEGSDDSHHIHSSTTSSNSQLTLTGIEYYNNFNLRALESLFSGANKNLKLTVTHKGGVYYDITLSDLCTTPTATQYTLSDNSKTYTGSSLSPTITPASGAGTVSKVYYDNVEGTGKTNAGTYAIKVDVNAGATYCSATGISLGNFVINKANQAAISAINGVSGTLCTGVEYTLSITGGSGTGTVTYTKESGTASATITGDKITFTGSGTYKIKAVKAADNNYNESSAAYTSDLTINAGSVGGTATATASSVCSGSGTTITLTGNTGTIQWQSSTNGTDYSDISGATSSPLSTGNLTVKTWYRATVTNGSCGSANSSVATVDITSVPTVSIISGPDKMCGSLTEAGTYTATSIDGASYTWSNNVDGLSTNPTTSNTVTCTTGAVVSSGKIFVYATLSGCNSNTAEKSVAIVTRPTVIGTTGASRCGTGTADISAIVSGGSVDWYDAASAGTKKGSSASGVNFTTASLSENTTFYAEAADGECLSATRTAAAVTIKTGPVLSAISGSATTTQYKPETYTASGSNLGTLTWAIVGAPEHANISATTGSTTVFKAKNGSYTLSVTATNDGCTDNETKGITVSTDSETCP